jgi:hypothetical protein
MLTELLIRDETISSLGKTEALYFAIHWFGETTNLRDLIQQFSKSLFI